MSQTRISIFIFLILAFAGYFFYQSRTFVFGPGISVFEPSDGEIVRNSHVVVKGKAKNIASLELDGRRIFTLEDGSFQEDLLLASGYNIIELSAEDKLGQKIEKQIAVMLKDE